jgi:hypothetical protein
MAYEDVVADVESASRTLVERCLRFHENPRSVRTMSTVQVRQPIYASSIGRWHRYAVHLGPLLRLLD